MDDEKDGNVVNLFGGDILKVEVTEEEISSSELLSRAAECGFDQMLILGAGDGDVGFITNIHTIPELIYLMERIKHYLITIGIDDENE